MESKDLNQDSTNELINLAKSEVVSSVLDIAGVNYTVIDTDGNYIFQNGSILSLIHQTSNEMPNAAKVDLKSWEDCQAVMASKQRTVKEEQFEGKYLLSIKQPILSNDKCLGILVVSLDITDKKKAEQSKHEFLRNMGHDIRTPLVGIYSLAQYLQDEEQDSSKQEMLSDIVHSSERLTALLNQVLEITALGSMPVKNAPYNINDIVKEVIELMLAAIRAKGLELIVTCPEAIIELDKFRVSRILLNMLSNAIKFTQQGTIQILVETCPKLIISVQDTGIGIAQNKFSDIFDRFTKIKQSGESQTFTGAGIGLYVAKQFATELNGTISVQSEIDKGSTFTFAQA